MAPISVNELLALSDPELAEFLSKNRGPDGYHIAVDDLENLSEDQRSRLAERLKAQQQALAQSPTACSRPFDLVELDARLRAISDDNPRSRASTPPIPPNYHYRVRVRTETQAYYALVNDGGRPLYPIDLVEQVLSDPDAYREMIRPWRRDFSLFRPMVYSGAGTEEVFTRQERRWTDFSWWQRDNRGIENHEDDGFAAYVEREKLMRKACLFTDDTMHEYAEWVATLKPTDFRQAWAIAQTDRARHCHHYRERGCRGFTDYAEAVKRRLANHNFTRPLQLHQDPKQQDKLTTWIEYINYEYWWLDRHTTTLERLSPVHDEAWQALVNRKVLRPRETADTLHSDAFGWRLPTEVDQAF